MKQIYILTVISLLLGVGMASAQLHDQWNKTYGGANPDVGYSVVEVAGGGYAMAGYINVGVGNDDFYLVRTDAAGGILWTRTFGGAGSDICYTLIQTSDGGFAMAGFTSVYAGNDDFMLVKTDGNGDNAVTRTFGGAGLQQCYTLIETADNGLALGGYTTTGFSSINLKTASSYAVLAGTSVTNSNGSVVNGDVGVDPGATVNGFPPGVVNGNVHNSDAEAAQAQSDLTDAYLDAAGRNNGPVELAGNIGGQSLDPGLYFSTSTLEISAGDLTLDAHGNPEAIWIFQIATTFTTTDSRKIILVDSAQAGNVYWQVGSSATLGTNSIFKGSILALTSITITSGAIVEGRALARNGTVTLDNNILTVPYGGEDFMLVTTDADGNNAVIHTYGGAGRERCHSLIQTADGGFALGGWTTSVGAGGYDFWLLKTAVNGDSSWSQSYGGVGSDLCYSLILTADGGFALGGVTTSAGAGNSDFWMVKTASNGVSTWSQTYGGGSAEQANSLIEAVDGGYFLAGSTTSYGAGSIDAWMVRADTTGGLLWNHTFGGVGDEVANSIIQIADSGLVLLGETNTYGAGDKDFYLIKNDQLTMPTDLYSMIGSVVQGVFDPTARWSGLLGAVGVDWRVSQWNHANQGYIRLGESDQNGNNWGDPEPMTAGKSFWIIHHLPAGIDLPMQGDLISTTTLVDVPLNMDEDSTELLTRGLTMVANPFPRTWNWNTVSLVRAGGAALTMATAVDSSVISPYAYQYDPSGGYDNYAPRSYLNPFDFRPGEGFWMQTFFPDYEGDALSVRFNTAGLPDPNPGRDEPMGWELSMIVTCSDGIHGTNENKLGCKSNSVDGFDVWDASEFGSLGSASSQHFFPHPEQEFGRPGSYTYDFRSLEFGAPKVWNFTIKVSNLPDQTFTLTYPDIVDVPEAYTLILRDEDNNQIIGNMREVSQVSFKAIGNDVQRHFSVTCKGVTSAPPSPKEQTLPVGFGLISAYPNPFNGITKITFGLSEASQISIRAFDVAGREVAVIHQGHQTSGVHELNWNAEGISSGIYFIRLEANSKVASEKITLIR